MADVFISYATEDRERVKPIVEVIEEAGFSVWWDRRIGLGASFDREIERELDAARCVVVVWSARSVDSDWVRNEAQEGLDRGVLVPLVIGDVRPPLAFRRAQTATLSEDPAGDELNLILAAVQSSIEKSGSDHAVTGSNDDEHRETPPPSLMPRWNRPLTAVGLSTIIVLVLGGLWWMQEPHQFPEDSSAEEAVAPGKPSIAVLPFVNLSNDPEQEFFSDGIAEDILNELARSKSLAVRARSSSFSLKGQRLDLGTIGERLNVTHVLEGSVRRSGDRLRVTVQLSDVSLDMPVWSNRYEREMTDIFAVQDEITSEISTALDVELGISRPPREFAGTEAYEAYLLGRHHHSAGDWSEAIRWLERATTIDPGNADAWAHLSYMYSLVGFTRGASSELNQKRRSALEHALRVDPKQPAALAMQALGELRNQQYQAGIDQLVQLARDHPNSAFVLLHLSFALRGVRMLDQAERTVLRLTELDPLSSYPNLRVEFLTIGGRIDEARQVLDAYRLKTNRSPTYVDFELAFAEGDVKAMRTTLEQSTATGQPFLMYQALLAYMEGDETALREKIDAFRGSGEALSYVMQSRVALLEGELAEAVRLWRAGADSGEGYAYFHMAGQYSWRRTFPDYFEQPAYQQMLIDFGLDAESRSKIVVPELPF